MSRLKKLKTHILVCEHKDCERRGGKEALKELKHALKESGLRRAQVLVTRVDCLDQCDDGPVMAVYPEGVWYGRVDAECARAIADGLAGRGGDRNGCRVLRDMGGRAVEE